MLKVPYFYYKYCPAFSDYISKKDLNRKSKMKKHVEENIGDNLCNLQDDKDFQNKKSTSFLKKKKMIIWSSREVKHSTFHHTVKQIKRQDTGKEKIFVEPTAESVSVFVRALTTP